VERKLLIFAIVGTTLVACTSAPRTTPSQTPRAIHPAPAAPPRTIAFPKLTKQGVAVERAGAVVFVALDGHVLGRLQGFTLVAGAVDAPGALVLRLEHAWYVLDAASSILRHVAGRRAEHLATAVDPAIDLPTPPGMVWDHEGYWRYAMLSPDGNHVLAQWIAHGTTHACDVPIAYVETLQSGPPIPVTGSAQVGEIPASLVLGWTRTDRALVLLFGPACDPSVSRPGVYTVDPAGGIEWVTRAKVPFARMWNTS